VYSRLNNDVTEQDDGRNEKQTEPEAWTTVHVPILCITATHTFNNIHTIDNIIVNIQENHRLKQERKHQTPEFHYHAYHGDYDN